MTPRIITEENKRNKNCDSTKHETSPESTVRTSLPRHMGGRGLSGVTEICFEHVISLRRYFSQKRNNLKNGINGIAKSDLGYTPLNLNNTQHPPLVT